MRFVVVPALVMVLVAAPYRVSAQSQADAWRGFAAKLAVGADLTVRLQDGQRFRATLIGVREDTLLVQPVTRVPVPVQAVPYDAIATIERRVAGKSNAVKATVIGVATGVGSFFVIMLILTAALD
jgi:hypothetical protein